MVLFAFYGLLFVEGLGVRSDRGSYLLFAWCGLVTWTFFASAISAGATSLVNAQALVTKVYFPREIVPLASAVVATLDLAIGTALLLVIAVIGGPGLSVALLFLPLVFLALLLLAAAAAVIAATLAAFGRDVLHALPLLIQAGFVATPVMYPRSTIPDRFGWVYSANPVALIIESVRTIVIDQRSPNMVPLGFLLISGVAVLYLAIFYLHSVEHRLADLA